MYRDGTGGALCQARPAGAPDLRQQPSCPFSPVSMEGDLAVADRRYDRHKLRETFAPLILAWIFAAAESSTACAQRNDPEGGKAL